MPRVSSFGLNQSLLADLLRNQERIARGQQQINSGKKAQQYKGLSREVETLLGAKALKTRNAAQLGVVTEVRGRLNFNDVHLESLRTTMEDLRKFILTSVANDQIIAFNDTLKGSFNAIVNSLNADMGGVRLFGGLRSDTAPVTVSTISGLQGLASVSDAFQNSQVKPAARVDDSVTMEFGLLADQVGQSSLQVIRDLADFNSGPNGPLDGPLTATQRSFLESELPVIDAAIGNLLQTSTINGERLKRLDTVQNRTEADITFLSKFISDIEDVDMTEAILNLKSNQQALQASFSSLGTLFKLSLLDFI